MKEELTEVKARLGAGSALLQTYELEVKLSSNKHTSSSRTLYIASNVLICALFYLVSLYISLLLLSGT